MMLVSLFLAIPVCALAGLHVFSVLGGSWGKAVLTGPGRRGRIILPGVESRAIAST